MAKKYFLMTMAFFVALSAIAGGQTLAGDNFPNHPVTLVYGYPPGGVAGNTARGVATGAEKMLGQSVVCLSKPGAAGTIAVNFVFDSKPDGYTLLNCGTPNICLGIYTQNANYKMEDFVPIIGYARMNIAFICRADAPWKTWDEWVAYARGNPGAKYGTWGANGGAHLAMEWTAKQENIKVIPVHFKGDSTGITNLMGGHIEIYGAAGSHASLVKSGKLRTLLQLSGVPTDPDTKSVTFFADKYPRGPIDYMSAPFGVFGPKNVPEDIRKTLTAAFRAGAQDPSFLKVLSTMNMSPVLIEPEKLREEMDKAYEQYGMLYKLKTITK